MTITASEGTTGQSGLIIPENIPGDDLRPWQLESVAETLRTAGSGAVAQAEVAEASWAGLPGVLESPQGSTIYAALGTPTTAATAIAEKFDRVATALDEFAAALRPIKETFAEIKRDAVEFRATITWDERVWVSPHETKEYEHNGLAMVSTTPGYSTSYSTGSTQADVLSYLRGRGESTRVSGGQVQILAPWTESSEHIDQNNALMDRLADAYTRLQNAEADCANAINRQRDMCMVEIEHIEAWQLKQSGENTVVLPWGSRVEEDRNCGESFWWGVGSAGKEMLEGAGGLIGYNGVRGDWSWEQVGQSWLGAVQGIGSLLVITSPPLLLLGMAGVPVLRDGVAMGGEMLKGLAAWDTWSQNPSEAAGRVLVNVGSMFIPGAGQVGAAVKALSAGSRIIDLAGDAARLTDAATSGVTKLDGLVVKLDGLVGDAIGTGLRVDDVVSVGVRTDLPDTDALQVGARSGDTPPPSSFVDDGPGPRNGGGEGPSGPLGHGDDTPGPGVGGDGPSGSGPGGGSALGESASGDSSFAVREPEGGGGGGVGSPPPPSRVYEMMDGRPHTTAFAPEQLPPTRVSDQFLAAHGTTRAEFIDIVNTKRADLDAAQLTKLENVRAALAVFDPDTVFQKVLDQPYFDARGALVRGQGDDVVLDNAATMGGSVTVVDDTSRLGSTRALHDGLRLDYDGTHFKVDPPSGEINSMYVMRFQVDNPSAFRPPLNQDFGGPADSSLNTRSHPFTGNGFTAAADDIVPEYIGGGTIRPGAEIWEVLSDGTQRLYAVWRSNEWIPQG